MFNRKFVVASCASLLGLAQAAGAADLVVMNTDSTTVPGAKVYTIGVQVSQADVAAALADPMTPQNIVLGVQEVDFVGNILNSQQTNPFNYRSLQSIQTQYIDNAAYNNPVAPGNSAGPPGDLGTAGDKALYASSWWYVSSNGQLTGVNNSSGDSGPITTTPAADGSGVYTVGTANNVGPTGLDWVAYPNSTPGTPGMSLTYASYGFIAAAQQYVGYLDQAPVNSQFVNGVLTVPLAQVVTNGNVSFDFSTIPGANGSPQFGNNFINLDNVAFNFVGGSWLVDPHAVLDFSTNTIHSMLTSGGGAAAVGGIQVNPSLITTDGNLTSTYSTTSPTDLAQTIGADAAGQIHFALAGSTVQAWDVQYTGTLSGSNTIVFHYDPSLIGNTPEAELRIEHFVNGAWVAPAGQIVDTTAHTITFQTDSFSPFVLAQVPEPSSMTLAGLAALMALGALRRAKQRSRR